MNTFKIDSWHDAFYHSVDPLLNEAQKLTYGSMAPENTNRSDIHKSLLRLCESCKQRIQILPILSCFFLPKLAEWKYIRQQYNNNNTDDGNTALWWCAFASTAATNKIDYDSTNSSAGNPDIIQLYLEAQGRANILLHEIVEMLHTSSC